MHYPRVLTIAGSDSGGGAGIQADIKAISATGSYAASAITAVTVQNTLGVEDVYPVPPEKIAAQIRCVLTDIGADAIKIGMLHSAEVVMAVRDSLLEYFMPGGAVGVSPVAFGRDPETELSACISAAAPSPAPSPGIPAPRNIVLDPVMVATSGHRLIEESAIRVLSSELIPIARVITPNIPEAEILGDTKVHFQSELPALACKLSLGGRVSVLLKAGHLTDDRLVDVFYNAEEDRILELPSERVHTPNTHGTGCTLSSALASYLAQGLSLDDAARAATTYIHEAIVSGARYEIGHGHGPVDHFWHQRHYLQNADNQ